MNYKRILAISVIVLAVFACMGVASAGLFDFLDSGAQNNQTYKFDGFTLDYAKGANFSNHTLDVQGSKIKNYATEYSPDGKKSYIMLIQSLTGDGIVKSIDDFKNNWLSMGAKDLGNYKKWAILDFKTVPSSYLDYYGIDLNVTRYALAEHNGTQIVLLEGNDLNELKKVSDTYKEA